jgi:MoxR-like ATPase
MWFSEFSEAQAPETRELLENGRPVDKGQGYVFQPDLIAAIDVAIGLGRPLLVAGEPGSGKTELGYAIARRMGIPHVHAFQVKSNSDAGDLFYTYDAIKRFRDAQLLGLRAQRGRTQEEPDIGEYVEFQALGRAILDAHEAGDIKHLLRGANPYAHPGTPRRSVVVIDEIDKAPRDFPNDLLREIEDLSFRVKEFPPVQIDGIEFEPETPTGTKIDTGVRPIIVITSNEERQLPDPFLRRCIFHEIAFPDEATLAKIIENGLRKRRLQWTSDDHAGTGLSLSDEDRAQFIQVVGAFREEPLEKRPGIAEMIDAAALVALPSDVKEAPPPLWERLNAAKTALAKVKRDRETFSIVLDRKVPKPA